MRLAVYALAWFACTILIAGSVFVLGTLILLYTALGPVACMYVGGRVGYALGCDFLTSSMLSLMGLYLFGSVRVRLYRHLLRAWRGVRRWGEQAQALRDDLWRQYRTVPARAKS